MKPNTHLITTFLLCVICVRLIAQADPAAPSQPAAFAASTNGQDSVRFHSLSTRGFVDYDENSMIAGFLVEGGNLDVVIRALGPSLPGHLIPTTLQNPAIRLHRGDTVIATNERYAEDELNHPLHLLGLTPENDREAALARTLEHGSYTVEVYPAGDGPGVSLIQLIQASPENDGSLTAISTLGQVGVGHNVLVAGFIIDSDEPMTVLIRGLGPSLDGPGLLPDPVLGLYRGSVRFSENRRWAEGAHHVSLTEAGLEPSHPDEAALLVTLLPGAYTAVLQGHHGATGTGVIEVLAMEGGRITAPPGAPGPDPDDFPSMLPFVLPWNDHKKTVTDLSDWNHKPAGANGFVTVNEAGHFVAGDERIRTWGINIGPETVFTEITDPDDYRAFAARLAKYGMNAVRYHHLGANWVHRNAFGLNPNPSTTEVDPVSFDRFSRWVAAFKEEGIYTNLNLLVSRQFRAADGLPQEIENIGWKEQGVVAFWHPHMIHLQKEYARQLLEPVNPYTGIPLAEDPALITVEINNEAGLIHGWYGRQMDGMPESLTEPLRRRWADFLKDKYDNQAALEEAWETVDQPLGDEMIAENRSVPVDSPWNLEQHEGAQATLTRVAGPDGREAGRVTVQQTGTDGWHVQLGYPGLQLEQGQPYTLGFMARSNASRTISIDSRLAQAPWSNVGLETSIDLTPEWKSYEFTFTATDSANARITFSGLSQQNLVVDIAAVSFRPGGNIGLPEGAAITNDHFPIPERDDIWGSSPTIRLDWFEFLRGVEIDYWTGIRDFLVDDLGVKAPVVGTIASTSPVTVQARLDAVDTHAYWQHPHFPGQPWHPSNWTVNNIPMVNQAQGGTVTSLALYAVEGKPHMVTEYDHPAPNQHAGEAPLIVGAYGALQDWDAIYFFAYGDDRDRWDPQRIRGFFDWMGHPTKMANAVAGAALFRRGDVAPAETTVTALMSEEEELDILAHRTGAWTLAHMDHLGIDRRMALKHRLRLILGDDPGVSPIPSFEAAPVITSDTGELTWDRQRQNAGLITINAPRSKGFVGYPDGREIVLDQVRLQVAPTELGWCTLMLTLLEGEDFDRPGRALLTLTGNVENTGMQWTSPQRVSVGSNWGTGPTVTEVITATVNLPGGVRVFPLTETGARMGYSIRADSAGNGRSAFTVGPHHGTIWYEIVWD